MNEVSGEFKVVTISRVKDSVKADVLEDYLNKGWRISQVSGFNDALVYILVDEATAKKLQQTQSPNRLSIPEA